MRRFFEHGGSWVVAQAFILIATFAAPYLQEGKLNPPTICMIGVAVVTWGGVQAALGAWALGRDLTPLPYPEAKSSLRTSGAYRLVRHPIYGGIVLLAFGQAMITRTHITLPLAMLITFFFLLKANREERWLRNRYPDYAQYAQQTKKLIPWLL